MSGFLYDDNNYVKVYVDGSCLNQGYGNAAAGYGIAFNLSHPE